MVHAMQNTDVNVTVWMASFVLNERIMKIESTDKEVRAILQSGYYRIPRFQRPYSWEKDHVRDFWNDIVIESKDDYFIGSMVVYKQEKGYFGIVDGQQRLTTITILLCVLRDIMNELGQRDAAEGVHSLVERKNIDNVPEFILSSESSYPYLQEHIQKFGEPDLDVQPLEEEKTLHSAYKQIEKLVKGVVDSVKVDTGVNDDNKPGIISQKLRGIRDRLLDLKVIFIELDDEDDAYIIFETLNTRGKDLNTADLVKNHVTKLIKAGNANVDATKEKWAKLRKTIEESDADIELDPFLHIFWLSRYEFVTKKKLFKVVKKNVKRKNAKEFLDNLLEDAETYRSMHEPDYKNWAREEIEIVRSLDALNLFRVKLQHPTVMAVLRDYFHGKIKKASAERIITSIAKFHFLFTAVTSQRSSGGISQMYASYARQICAADGAHEKNELINEFKKKLRSKVPTYEEFEVNFLQISYTKTNSKQKKLVQYILSSMQRNTDIGIPIDYSQMTIEHIYPENPTSSPNDEDSVGLIGNLILCDHALNVKLANKPFCEKKKILEKHNIVQDSYITTCNEWGQAEIIQRTKSLCKAAYEDVWKI